MRRLTIVGAFLAAMLFANATASASQPEFYVATAIGKVAPTVPFSGTIGTTVLQASGTGHPKIECTGGTITGVAMTATEAKSINIVLTGCESLALSKPCESGSTAGEIKIHTLEGVLGNVATSVPGLRLANEPLGPGPHEITKFKCGTATFESRGSVIAKLTGDEGEPVGSYIVPAAFHSSFNMDFVETAGIQKFVEFLPLQGPPGTEQQEASVNSGPYEDVGTRTTFTLQSVPAQVLGITK